jgi:hypothetical protein
VGSAYSSIRRIQGKLNPHREIIANADSVSAHLGTVVINGIIGSVRRPGSARRPAC